MQYELPEAVDNSGRGITEKLYTFSRVWMLEENTRMGDRSRGECLTGMADDLHSHYTQTSVGEKPAY